MEGAEVKGKHGSFRMTRKSLMITDKHYSKRKTEIGIYLEDESEKD